MSFDPKVMGSTIRKLRKKKKMTQEVFSGFADVGRSHLSALEHGHVGSVDTYDKIAAAFDMPLSELFRLAEEEMKKKAD